MSKYDGFYSAAVKRIRRIPRIINLVNSFVYIQYVLKRLSGLAGRIGLERFSCFFANISSQFSIYDRNRALFENKLLLVQLFKKIQNEASLRNDRMIFVLAPLIEDMAFQEKFGHLPYNLSFLNEHKINLNFFTGTSIHQVDYRKLFVDQKWGGHYSAFGNNIFAKYIEGLLGEAEIKL